VRSSGEGDVIEIRALTKSYGPTRAVDDLSFTAPSGQVTGFLGPNGAGKTTTVRCLLGLAEPTSGAACFDGRAYQDLSQPRREVGAMLESTGFHPTRTARQHLQVVARAARLDPARIGPLLDLVGLTSAADRRVRGYSLGMRQRLGLATAMLGDPPTLVLDEPANGLDPSGVAWVRQLLRTWADDGRTVLVSSHLLAEISQVVDRVVIVRGGRLAAEVDIATLGSGRVTVRVDKVEPLVDALRQAGVDHQLQADDSITVTGREPAEVGALAARAGVTVVELGRRRTGEQLEDLFLELTGGEAR
jgi:ABC-2 type transport system ATP-binding protein